MKRILSWLKKTFDEKIGETHTRSYMKQTLHASVVRACPKCGASGVDKKNHDVGEYCPQCGELRPQQENLGKIWER